MIKLQELTPANVHRAYLGKPGCMCGCKGKYYTSTKVDHSTVNPAMVTKILRTIQANEDLLETDNNWLAARVGGKEYVVYVSE